MTGKSQQKEPSKVLNIEALVGLPVEIPKGDHMREARCPGCQKKWFDEYIFKGVIQIFCTGCKTMYRISYKHKNNATI